MAMMHTHVKHLRGGPRDGERIMVAEDPPGPVIVFPPINWAKHPGVEDASPLTTGRYERKLGRPAGDENGIPVFDYEWQGWQR